MKRFLILVLTVLSVTSIQAQGTYSIGLLKYNGGGDWYANPTSLTNLISFCNKNIGTNISPDAITVDAGNPEIFNLPFVHMTGHGNVIFSPSESDNLRTYLIAGGFLHVDDNYGMDPFIRPQLKRIFPELDLVELPPSHPIFHQKFDFPGGLPKIHEHDGTAPQAFGMFWEGRLVVLYTFECDLGDGWEDASVHKDSESARQKALKMGANMLQYVLMANDPIKRQ
ncbi:MAG TPA: DUF4159 domain-containing protein [Flavobacteriales bacterium]|nr:DUF4159 domain-containing protein [Flavobacteriales bacterium]HPH83443.1 DUF4159 domain-containing protein [Flavobacteriales bacterium]